MRFNKKYYIKRKRFNFGKGIGFMLILGSLFLFLGSSDIGAFFWETERSGDRVEVCVSLFWKASLREQGNVI